MFNFLIFKIKWKIANKNCSVFDLNWINIVTSVWLGFSLIYEFYSFISNPIYSFISIESFEISKNTKIMTLFISWIHPFKLFFLYLLFLYHLIIFIIYFNNFITKVQFHLKESVFLYFLLIFLHHYILIPIFFSKFKVTIFYYISFLIIIVLIIQKIYI